MCTAAVTTGEAMLGLLPGLRSTYDGAPQAVCVVLGQELRVVYLNPTALRMGHPRDDETVIGRTIGEALPNIREGRLRRVLRSGQAMVRTAVPYRGGDGEMRFWDFTAHPLMHEAGPIGLILSASDVTVRERNAGAGVAELPAILDGMADAVLVLRAGRCARVNAAALRLCGESGPEELVGLSTRDLKQRYLYEPLHGAGLSRRGAVRRLEGVTARVVRRDGTTAIISGSVSPLAGSGGESSVVCVLRDVTAEHQTQRALDEALADSRRQAERLAAIIESIPVGVRIWDREGRLRQQNRQALDIAGEPGPTDGSGVPMPDAATARALRGEPVDPGEVTIVDGSGAQRHLLVSAAPLYGSDGTVAEAVSVLVDQTDKRRLERLKDEFLAILAHELRNPLAAAQASLQAAKRALATMEAPAAPGLPRVARHVKHGLEQVTRVGGILANLLEVGRVGTVRSRMGIQEVDLVKLCRRVVQEAGAADVLHTYAFESAVPHLAARVDPHAVAEVVACLLSNARKYSGPGLPIRVELEQSGDQVAVRVRDHGVGVPRGEEERIFDGFYRAENVRGPGGPSGLGIGLFVARTLVAHHGGTIGVEGRPGGGSVFTFVLPLGL